MRQQRASVVLVDDNGYEIRRPERDDFASQVEFVRAVHAWRNRVTNCANKAFDDALRLALKKSSG